MTASGYAPIAVVAAVDFSTRPPTSRKRSMLDTNVSYPDGAVSNGSSSHDHEPNLEFVAGWTS